MSAVAKLIGQRYHIKDEMIRAFAFDVVQSEGWGWGRGMSGNLFTRIADSAVGQKIGLSESKARMAVYGGASALALIGVYSAYSANQVSCSSSGAQDAVAQVAKDNRSSRLFAWSLAIYKSSAGEQSCEEDATCASAKKAYDAAFREMQSISQKCEAIQALDENDSCPVFTEEAPVMVSDAVSGANPYGKEYYPRDEALNEARVSGVADAAEAAQNYATMGLPPAEYQRIMKLPERTDSERRKFMTLTMDQLIGYNSAVDAIKQAREALTRNSQKLKNQKFDEAIANTNYDLTDIVTLQQNKDVDRVSCQAEITASSGNLSPISWRIKYVISKTSDGNLIAEVWGL